MIIYWISIIVAIAVGKTMLGDSASLVQPTAMVLIFTPILGFVISAYGKASFSFLKRLILRKVNSSDASNISKICTITLCAGFLGCALGTIQVVSNLNSPVSYGMGLATVTHSIFWSAIVILMLKPANMDA